MRHSVIDGRALWIANGWTMFRWFSLSLFFLSRYEKYKTVSQNKLETIKVMRWHSNHFNSWNNDECSCKYGCTEMHLYRGLQMHKSHLAFYLRTNSGCFASHCIGLHWNYNERTLEKGRINFDVRRATYLTKYWSDGITCQAI